MIEYSNYKDQTPRKIFKMAQKKLKKSSVPKTAKTAKVVKTALAAKASVSSKAPVTSKGPATKQGKTLLATKPITAVAKTALEKGSKKDPLAQVLASQAPTVAESKLKESLKKESILTLKSNLRIFQIYYEEWQRELLDSHFIPLNNGKVKSELLEFSVFERLAASDYVKGAQLWGALSWRFTEKTGMAGADWIKGIQTNPGFDVYYCDAFPHNQALFHNLWLQGETTHPNFLAISQAVFQAAGLPAEELLTLVPSNQYSSANYFVGTPKFWAEYLPWVKGIVNLANKKLPPQIRDLMHSPKADINDLHSGATYLPFIIERLFPIFMKTKGQNLKGFQIPLPEKDRELNVHLKLLREMKDVACKTKSAWLIACWVNYRNLYLTQVNKKEWCKKYLRIITPTSIKFS